MTRGEFEIFLLSSAILCLVTAAATLLRYKSRGPAAFALAGACTVLAAVLMLLRADADRDLVIAGFALVGVLLLADVGLRAKKGGSFK